jgi:hypothetical protein
VSTGAKPWDVAALLRDQPVTAPVTSRAGDVAGFAGCVAKARWLLEIDRENEFLARSLAKAEPLAMKAEAMINDVMAVRMGLFLVGICPAVGLNRLPDFCFDVASLPPSMHRRSSSRRSNSNDGRVLHAK